MKYDSFDTLRAKRLLVHYFRTVFEAAGLRWDSDNQAEIETAVEYLIDAAAQSALDRIKGVEDGCKNKHA
jgi:hypothetical protein